MSTESKPNNQPSQTWGEFKKMQSGGEKDEYSMDWFNAGLLDSISLDKPDSIQALHHRLDSFNKVMKETPVRPFKFVVVPSVLDQTNQTVDVNEIIIKLEPASNKVSLEDLREFTNKVKG